MFIHSDQALLVQAYPVIRFRKGVLLLRSVRDCFKYCDVQEASSRIAPRPDSPLIGNCRTSPFVKGYSMPAVGRKNVPASAHVGRRRINPMEETTECPNAAGGFTAMAIDRPGCSVVSDAARSGGVPDGR